jgi:hypothetical protein
MYSGQELLSLLHVYKELLSQRFCGVHLIAHHQPSYIRSVPNYYNLYFYLRYLIMR